MPGRSLAPLALIVALAVRFLLTGISLFSA